MGNKVTQGRLQELLSYDINTGVFTWRVARRGYGGSVKPGVAADNIGASGYTRIGIDGHRYQAHILAWLYVYGVFPEKQIDHINRVRTDNRICNLRLSTQGENLQNQGVRSDNKSGQQGVSWDAVRKKWFAKITSNRQQFPLGRFALLSDAIAAYVTAKAKIHTFHPGAVSR